MNLRIGIIFGGRSVEHEVSIISALDAAKHIDRDKYDVVYIYISKEGVWYTGPWLKDLENYQDIEYLKKRSKEVVLARIDNEICLLSTKGIFNRVVDKIDIAFPIVHGEHVEDGVIAGVLDNLDIPYIGSKVLGDALGQDKVVLKQVLDHEGIPVVPYEYFYDSDYYLEEDEIIKRIEKMGYPVIVKPACLGSSIGITSASDRKSLRKAIEDAITYDAKIIVEKCVNNLMEVNISVKGNHELQETSVIEEVTSGHDILTYNDKYIGGKKKGLKASPSKGMVNASRRIPAKISHKLEEQIEELGIKTFKTLNLSGVCRIDFLIDKENDKVYVNEPNTIPGSLSYYLWTKKGVTYEKLLDDLISLAIKEYKETSKKTTYFESNILANYNGIKGVKK